MQETFYLPEEGSVHHDSHGDGAAPITPRGLLRIFSVLTLCWDFVRSSFLPARDEPHAWYDRIIRGVGGILIFSVLAGGLVGLIMEVIAKYNH
jgi:hypothetical protein